MKAAIYCRVSTDDQRERETIQLQRDHAQKYADLHGIEIVRFYEDDGVSGKLALEERPSGQRLLRDAQAGQFDTVLVFKLDRLARSPRHCLNAVARLTDLGVPLQSMTEAFETATPNGQFQMNMLAIMAGWECDSILMRTREGRNAAARQGRWLGGVVPFGYVVVKVGKEQRLMPSEEPLPNVGISEADVVREIFRLTVHEKKTCRLIAEHLQRLGVLTSYVRDGRQTTRNGVKQDTLGVWRPGNISSLLKNTVYRGLYEDGKRSKQKREVIQSEAPRLVDDELWFAAQEALKHNKLDSMRNAKQKYLLRGLMKCGDCNLTLIGSFREVKKTGATRIFYVCNGRQNARALFGEGGKKCHSRSTKGEVEDIIWADVEKFLRNPGDVLAEVAATLRDQAEDITGLDERANHLRRELAANQKRRNAAVALFLDGKIDQAALNFQLERLDKQEATIKGNLQDVDVQQAEVQNSSRNLRSAEDVLLALNCKLDQPLEWETKRHLIETLVDSITVHTIEKDGVQANDVHVYYRFGSTEPSLKGSIENRTVGRAASALRGCRRPLARSNQMAAALPKHGAKARLPATRE